MRYIIVSILLFVSVLAGAQNTGETGKEGYKRQGDTFIQTKTRDYGTIPDQVTAYTWKDSKGNEYPIVLHTYSKGDKKGVTTCYVMKKSAKTGKEYKYYLPDGESIAEEIIAENL